jgi:hypothetical protein
VPRREVRRVGQSGSSVVAVRWRCAARADFGGRAEAKVGCGSFRNRRDAEAAEAVKSGNSLEALFRGDRLNARGGGRGSGGRPSGKVWIQGDARAPDQEVGCRRMRFG